MPANPPPITIAEGVCDFLLALSPYEPEKKKIVPQIQIDKLNKKVQTKEMLNSVYFFLAINFIKLYIKY
jgi:hypothetical protein